MGALHQLFNQVPLLALLLTVALCYISDLLEDYHTRGQATG